MTSSYSVCSFCSAYHGHLSSLIDISPYKFHQLGQCEQSQHVHVVSAEKIFKHVDKRIPCTSTPTPSTPTVNLLLVS